MADNLIAGTGVVFTGAGVTLVDAAGNVFHATKPAGSYWAGIAARHIAADAAGTIVFELINPSGSGKVFRVKAVRGIVAFDGTAAAATTRGYELIRYTGITGDTGGTAITPSKKDTTNANASVAHVRTGVGAAQTAGTAETSPFHTIGLPLSATGVSMEFDADPYQGAAAWEPYLLQAGEGLIIRVSVAGAAVIGLGINGGVEWDEA